MQALGVVLTPTRRTTWDELAELNENIKVPSEVPERTQSLTRTLHRAVSTIGTAEWTVANNWDVTISTHRTNQQNKRKTTYSLHRVCRPRSARETHVYNDIVGKIVLHNPIRQAVPTGDGTFRSPINPNSARLQTFLTPEGNLPGIHPDEWGHIRNYLTAIVTEYQDGSDGWAEGARLRHYLTRTAAWLGILPSAGVGIPRLAPIQQTDRIHETIPHFAQAGIEVETFTISKADTIIQRAIEGPLQTLEKTIHTQLNKVKPKPLAARQWLFTSQIHDQLDQAINQTTPRPYLDQSQAKAIEILKNG